MKTQILQIILENPTSYPSILKKKLEMLQWIYKNSLVTSNSLSEHAYSAIYQQNGICKYGNNQKFKRFNRGFYGCGPASSCTCTRENICSSVKKTKEQVSTTLQSEINKKRSKTMINKYGVEFNSQRNDVKPMLSKPKISEYAHACLTDYNWLDNEYNINKRSAVDIADELDIYYSTVIEYCKKHNFTIRSNSNYSLIEKQIESYINTLHVESIPHDRTILDGKEIDILIPSHNLGIEINGLYWHSFNPESTQIEYKNRHIDKTNLANSKGINLIHISDWEWNNKQAIIKSILKSKLQLTTKLYARKCTIIELDTNQAKDFFNSNHLQGFAPAKYYYGLLYNNQLQMAISIGRDRFSKISESYELIRMAALLNVTVVGGASKLISHAKRQINNATIVSYCDRNKSNGNGYTSIGFQLDRVTGPGFCWTDGNTIISRYKCQTQNLKKWLPNYNNMLSQTENMFANKYRRIWDCGNYVFKI
jgi:hypothetical protein